MRMSSPSPVVHRRSSASQNLVTQVEEAFEKIVTNSGDIYVALTFLIRKQTLLFYVDLAEKLRLNLQQKNDLELLRRKLYLKLISMQSTALSKEENKKFDEFVMNVKRDAKRIIGQCVTKTEYEDKFKLMELESMNTRIIIVKLFQLIIMNPFIPKLRKDTDMFIKETVEKFNKIVYKQMEKPTNSSTAEFFKEVNKMLIYRESEIVKTDNPRIEDILKSLTRLLFADLYRNEINI